MTTNRSRNNSVKLLQARGIHTWLDEKQILRGTSVLVLMPLNLDDYLFSDDWQGGWNNQLRSTAASIAAETYITGGP